MSEFLFFLEFFSSGLQTRWGWGGGCKLGRPKTSSRCGCRCRAHTRRSTFVSLRGPSSFQVPGSSRRLARGGARLPPASRLLKMAAGAKTRGGARGTLGAEVGRPRGGGRAGRGGAGPGASARAAAAAGVCGSRGLRPGGRGASRCRSWRCRRWSFTPWCCSVWWITSTGERGRGRPPGIAAAESRAGWAGVGSDSPAAGTTHGSRSLNPRLVPAPAPAPAGSPQPAARTGRAVCPRRCAAAVGARRAGPRGAPPFGPGAPVTSWAPPCRWRLSPAFRPRRPERAPLAGPWRLSRTRSPLMVT